MSSIVNCLMVNCFFCRKSPNFNKEIYVDFTAAQIKTLSILAYFIRIFQVGILSVFGKCYKFGTRTFALKAYHSAIFHNEGVSASFFFLTKVICKPLIIGLCSPALLQAFCFALEDHIFCF